MNPRSVGIFAVVVAIIVGGSIWFLNQDWAPHQAPPVEPASTPAPKITRNTPPPVTPVIPRTPDPAIVNAPPKPQVPVPTPQPEPTVEMTEDDKKIDAVLRGPNDGSDKANATMAQQLIGLMTQLTPTGQVECISHINNLLPDENYSLLMPIWKNATFNPEVLDAIATDLMNRDDKIKLPALLEAVRMPNHPQRDEAKSTLTVFLDEDYEDNFPKWEAGVKAYLKKQADEEAGIEPK